MGNNNMKLEFATLKSNRCISGSSDSCGNIDFSTIEWECTNKCIFGIPIKICLPKKK